jgi:hypothetical protein
MPFPSCESWNGDLFSKQTNEILRKKTLQHVLKALLEDLKIQLNWTKKKLNLKLKIVTLWSVLILFKFRNRKPFNLIVCFSGEGVVSFRFHKISFDIWLWEIHSSKRIINSDANTINTQKFFFEICYSKLKSWNSKQHVTTAGIHTVLV